MLGGPHRATSLVMLYTVVAQGLVERSRLSYVSSRQSSPPASDHKNMFNVYLIYHLFQNMNLFKNHL